MKLRNELHDRVKIGASGNPQLRRYAVLKMRLKSFLLPTYC